MRNLIIQHCSDSHEKCVNTSVGFPIRGVAMGRGLGPGMLHIYINGDTDKVNRYFIGPHQIKVSLLIQGFCLIPCVDWEGHDWIEWDGTAWAWDGAS